MIDFTKLQQLADNVGTIALQAAEAFVPGLAPTIVLAQTIIDTATDLAQSLSDDTKVDQTTLQQGLQALIDKVEAHADATIASLGPDDAADTITGA